MNKVLFWVTTLFVSLSFQADETFIERQGQITFFSYTAVENIEATNNQVLSQFNPNTGEIAVSILMRAFIFKKKLMRQHFNESYIESDLYPKATFTGFIEGFNSNLTDPQTKIIKGDFTLKGITTPMEFKADINQKNGDYQITGELEVNIDDYKIRVPKLLAPNIAKTIQVTFNFQYEPYEQ
ncbi:YceI family protein [Spongiivirga sp. MCCC 1A20706]|uniref:YceI family protein n=1 Tax=Spongiivirga sp. MCCC 1A20706 TaxID=3160963 RepID=UPI003977AA54